MNLKGKWKISGKYIPIKLQSQYMNAKHFTPDHNVIVWLRSLINKFNKILFGQGKYLESGGFYSMSNCGVLYN